MCIRLIVDWLLNSLKIPSCADGGNGSATGPCSWRGTGPWCSAPTTRSTAVGAHVAGRRVCVRDWAPSPSPVFIHVDVWAGSDAATRIGSGESAATVARGACLPCV